MTGMTVGIVSEREENGLGRVKVKLPSMENRETDWCRVVVPYGGKTNDGKAFGFLFVPEKNSEVAVAFYEGDPNVPIIVGSIYSAERKPPVANPDEHVIRSRRGDVITISDVKDKEKIAIETIEGQQFLMDAATKTIKLKNDHTITMAGDGKKIAIETKGGITLTLDDNDGSVTVSAKSVTISAGSIDFKKS